MKFTKPYSNANRALSFYSTLVVFVDESIVKWHGGSHDICNNKREDDQKVCANVSVRASPILKLVRVLFLVKIGETQELYRTYIL